MMSRLAIHKEIGISVGEAEVALSQVATTPLGRREVLKDRVDYEPDTLAKALETLLSKYFAPRELSRATVNLGLPVLRVFFSTRPVQAANLQASPEVLLHEVLQSPNLNIDDMVVDLVMAKPDQRPLASIVACRKKYLATVVGALEACGVVPARAEPAPFAILREATRKARSPRKSRSHIRILLGRDRGLAVLMAGSDLPLMWRGFVAVKEGEVDAILATIAALRILGTYCGSEVGVDSILVHGRPDLGPLDAIAKSPALDGIRVIRVDEPGLDDEVAALGLARGVSKGVGTFNLARSIERQLSMLDIFPWVQAAFQVLLLVSVSLFLEGRYRAIQGAAQAIRAEDAKYPWAAKLGSEKLKNEKKVLAEKADAIRSFLESRIRWTSYTQGLAANLPPDLALTGFQGTYELDLSANKGASKPKRSLLLRLAAPIPQTGAMPKEIDDFLRILRSDSLLKKDFPEIELADLRWGQSSGNAPIASFSVRCQPPKTATPPASTNTPSAASPAKSRGK